MESVSDPVLNGKKRDYTGTAHRCRTKSLAAGFDVSYYYMPGLGGKEYMEENAIQSATVINTVNPTFVRLRSTRSHTELHYMT
jgi:histone acetyltransferase (RNA polymerase elongator complex component)